jgi:hypothetical protein
MQTFAVKLEFPIEMPANIQLLHKLVFSNEPDDRPTFTAIIKMLSEE